jgi:hypothetical protein
MVFIRLAKFVTAGFLAVVSLAGMPPAAVADPNVAVLAFGLVGSQSVPPPGDPERRPWPDHVPVPSFGPRMVCTRCGIIGADAERYGCSPVVHSVSPKQSCWRTASRSRCLTPWCGPGWPRRHGRKCGQGGSGSRFIWLTITDDEGAEAAAAEHNCGAFTVGDCPNSQ